VPLAANRDWQIIVTRVLQGDLGCVFDERDNSSWPLCIGCPAIYRLFIVRVGGVYNFVLEALPEVGDVGHSEQTEDEVIDEWHCTTLFMSI
jgi:hypothetical protein